MISSSDIKKHLADYLSKQDDFERFEDWFVPNSRDIRKSQSEAAKALAFAVEGALSEYLSQVLNEQEFRDELLQALHADTVIVGIPQYFLASSVPTQYVGRSPMARKTDDFTVKGTAQLVFLPATV